MKVTEQGLYTVLENYIKQDILGKMSPAADVRNSVRIFLIGSSLNTLRDYFLVPKLAAMKLPDGSFLLPPLADAKEGLKMAGGSLVLPVNLPMGYDFTVKITEPDLNIIYAGLQKYEITEHESSEVTQDTTVE